jgi:Gas vesicle synthesis protein GvpL/GvpF
VVEALMEDRDLLPVRYGTRLGNERAAARALEDRHEELARALERVRGAVELSVRALRAREDEPEAASSGSEYLRARARTAAAAAELHQPLSAVARMSIRRPASLPTEVLRAAYLVDRGAIDGFTSLVRRLDAANPEVQLLCTGPWPPYSFAEQ